MKLPFAAALAAATLSIAGCGVTPGNKEDGDGARIVTENGSLTLATGKPPANLPPYAALYAGATAIEAVAAEANAGPEAGGGVVNYVASAAPAAVMAFHAKAAADAGLSSAMDSPADADGTQIRVWTQAGTKRSLSASVAPGDAAGQTKVSLIYGAP